MSALHRVLNLRKNGGIWFGSFGRIGFSFWVRKPATAPRSAWMDPA